MRFLRYLAGYAAIAAAIPYFVLKVIWLTGGEVGFTPATPESGEFDALNAVTFAMAAVAIAVALALTHGWGKRLPASVVLFPMWVGTGFLATIVIAVPIELISAAVQGQSLFSGDGGDGLVQPWVYQMVYAGFITQGVALLTAFFLYARDRWPTFPQEPATPTLRLLAVTGALMSFVLGAVYFAFPAGPRVMNVVFALMSIAGGAGILMMLRRKTWPGLLGRPASPREETAAPPGPTWPAVALAWAGAATNFSWGLWVTVNALMSSPLNIGDDGALGLVNLARVLAGMVIGMVAAVILSRPPVKVEG